ncbi:MAG: acyl-CoA carboxylase epsilon subunit [Micromonosporaceae bacterium]
MAEGAVATPVVRIRGNPTAEETAAVIALLAVASQASARAAARSQRETAGGALSGWRNSARPVQPPRHGPGAWRASGLPR